MNWYEATVLARRVVAGTVHLSLEVAEAVKASFIAPGQYLHVKVDAAHGPFAPASAPGAGGGLELLFKPGTYLTDLLARASVGDALHTSPCSGVGFPLEAARGRPLLLVASGTGQAPMRSVIDSVRRRRHDFGPVTLLLGVRDAEHLAFADEHAAWQREQIETHVVLSKGGENWKGRVGWVQGHLPNGDLEHTVAFVVGQRSMVEEVLAELTRRGMPRSQIFLNV